MRTTKYILGVAILVALSILGPTPAQAQGRSPEAKKAESLNAEGKKLVGSLDLDGAAERFREAWQLVRDPRFAFNLCYTLEKSGKLIEAQAACQKAVSAKDKRLAGKAKRLLKTIESKLATRPTPGEPAPGEPARPAGPPTEYPQPTPGQPYPTYPTYPTTGYQGAAYPQANYLVAPQRTTVNYFTHILIADAAAWSLIALSAGAESDGLIGLGVAGLVLGGPIVHLMQNNSRGAWLSTGVRVGLPLGGILIGTSSCDFDEDCFGSIIGGAVLGYGAALLLDWFVFAKKEKVSYPTQQMAMPTLELKDGGGIAGIRLQL